MALVFSNGNGQGVMLVTVSVVFEALALIAVALRIWSRRLQKRPLVANDYLIILALVWESRKPSPCLFNDNRVGGLNSTCCHYYYRQVSPLYLSIRSCANMPFPSAVVAGGLGQHTFEVITQPQKLIVFGKVSPAK